MLMMFKIRTRVFQPNTSLTSYRGEPALFDGSLPDFLESEPLTESDLEVSGPPQEKGNTTLSIHVVQFLETSNASSGERPANASKFVEDDIPIYNLERLETQMALNISRPLMCTQ